MQTRLLAVATAIALLAACSPAQPTPTSTPPTPTSPTTAQTPTSTPSPTPSPTPTPTPTVFPSFPADLPTEDPEVAAIIKGWQEYWRVYEKFTADPLGYTDFTETQYVTTGEQANVILDAIMRAREKNLKYVGPQIFRAVTVGAAELASNGHRQAVISYCADTSLRERLDATTGEPIEVDVSPTFTEQATMEEGADGVWRLAQMRNQEAAC